MHAFISRLRSHLTGPVVAVVAGLVLVAVFGLLVRTRPAPATPRGVPSIEAYRGLGCWVSIYEKAAWADPESAVRDMAGHGVKTLYLQSGNTNSKGVVYNVPAQQRFIVAAHASGMKVVAWYLPEMKDLAYDFDRIAAAIGLRTADGQSFDSFALDIESTKVKDTSVRATALAALTVRIRALVGPSYPLGGIVPSPVGIAKQTGFWNDFPYAAVAKSYDVMLPMAYYTYHGKGAAAAAADIATSMKILRATPGCAKVPVHMIGGLAAKSKPADVGAFASQSLASGCIGASLYSWSGTNAAEWAALQVLAR
jgi:hypothetical protein